MNCFVRVLFTLTFVIFAFPAYADICAAGACGHWYSPKIDVLIDGKTMRWTDGISSTCAIFAQDRHVTILDCTESRAGKKGEWEMYYFVQALGSDLHVRGTTDLPSCIARRSCWPEPGADFQRLSAPAE